MKKISLLLILFSFFFPKNLEARTWSRITIFACEPEWGYLAREIVGNDADVIIASTATQNPRRLVLNPNLFSMIRKADMVFCSGMGLENSWLPMLIEKSGNIKLQETDRNLMAADYVQKLPFEKADIKDLNWNPYFHLNPNNLILVAGELLNRLKIIDQGRSDIYQENFDKFKTTWKRNIARWEDRTKNLKNMPVVINDNGWFYLTSWLKLNVVAVINKPGKKIAPNSSQMNHLISDLKANPAETIISSIVADNNLVYFLFEKSGIKVSLLPHTVFTDNRIRNLTDVFDEIVVGLIYVSENNESKGHLKEVKMPKKVSGSDKVSDSDNNNLNQK